MKHSEAYEITLPALDGGLNVSEPEYAIDDHQSPDMLNLWYKDNALNKRNGQQRIVTLPDVQRISPMYNGYQAVHAGTKLYRWSGETVTEIQWGIANEAGVFVAFGDTLYYLDGSEIWEISCDYTVSAISSYAPVVMLNCMPDLSGSNDNEAYNLIGAGFTVKYNGDGTSTVYSLPQTGLDESIVEVSIGGVDLNEGVHFTVNRTNGTVNFGGGTSPNGAPDSGTNNVWITAFKTVYGNKQKIAGCRIALPFGGESSGVVGGTRVFVMGNPNHPYTYWRSDLGLHVSFGMKYFPDTAEEFFDQNSEAITAAAKMGGELIVFKQSSIFAVGYAYDGETVYYHVRECHSNIGCDMPGSVQLVDNRLVFANTKSGVHMLISTNNDLENIVKPLSGNINSMLLSESGLADACSCDFGQYYWLCVGGNVYLWDYGQTPYYNHSDYDKAQRRLAWYKFDNVDAADFYAGDVLVYGGGDGIVQFVESKNDFGEAFEAYYVSKAFDLGKPNEIKTFEYVYPSFCADRNVKVTVSVGNENTSCYRHRTFELQSFHWADFNWSLFSWHVIRYAKTYAMRIKMKNAVHIQITISSGDKDRGIGLSGLRVTYYTNRKIKR